MSIASVSAATSGYQSNGAQSIAQYLQTLSQALQSGNSTGAQQAYNTLMQSFPKQNAAASPSRQTAPFQQGLAKIGDALKSGDIAGAQAALQAFQRDTKAHSNHIAKVQGPGESAATSVAQPPPDQTRDSTARGTTPPSVATGPARFVGLVA